MSHAVVKRETPRSLGYRMPAEWARHRATWLAWPHNRETWPTQLEEIKEVWVNMMQALLPRERVCLLVNDEASRREVNARLKAGRAPLENLTIFEIPTVDVWMRDYGPTFVTKDFPASPLAFNDWIFNAWGGKYPSYEADDQIAKEIAALLKGVRVFNHDWVLEGGSIDVNGAGACLTTEQCLLNRNRNPRRSPSEIESFLKDSLGVTQVIWLGEGIAGDDTDGHVDDIARFVNPTTVVCAVEANARDENYAVLQENFQRLQQARDQVGHKLAVVPLPSPGPVYDQGERLPASYANFYIGNGVVLAPVFGDALDGQALGVLRELFPDREVIAVPCAAVVAGLGAVHCVTQQEPEVGSGP